MKQPNFYDENSQFLGSSESKKATAPARLLSQELVIVIFLLLSQLGKGYG